MDELFEAVQALVARLDPEPAHSDHVTHLAEQVFDQTTELHGYGPDERRLLTAAGLLHDIGYSISATGHNKHARDLILTSRLPGLEETELRVVALVARYHRKGPPQAKHRLYADLSPDEKRLVCALAGILRLADALDRTHQEAVTSIRVDRRPSEIVVALQLSDPDDGVSGELWAAERKKDLFEQTFGLPVRFELIARQ